MIDHKPPPNWVVERAKCNLDLTFEALAEVVKRDVDEMNQLSPKRRRNYEFSFEQNGEGVTPRLRVIRYPEGEPDADGALYVTFEKSTSAIRIVQAPDGTAFLASPTWVESTSSCRLQIDGEGFQVWEISQRFLGPLFFGLYPISSGVV